MYVATLPSSIRHPTVLPTRSGQLPIPSRVGQRRLAVPQIRGPLRGTTISEQQTDLASGGASPPRPPSNFKPTAEDDGKGDALQGIVSSLNGPGKAIGVALAVSTAVLGLLDVWMLARSSKKDIMRLDNNVSKLEQNMSKMEQKMEQNMSKLEQKIESFAAKVDQKFDKLEEGRMNTAIFQAKMEAWLTSTKQAAFLVTLASVILYCAKGGRGGGQSGGYRPQQGHT